MSKEVWKPVLGFEGLYEVSNKGRVKSLERFVGSGKKRRINYERILKAKPNSKYPEVKMYKNGRVFMNTIHCIVLEAFIGPCPKNMECRHLDGDSSNNFLGNLTWGTHLENMRDSIEHGTFVCGEDHKRSILTNNDARAIKKSSKKLKELVKQFGIGASSISRIRNGLSWRHV